MAKRLLCVVLSLLMIMAVLPTGVVADNTTYDEWSTTDSLPTNGTIKLTDNVTLTSGITLTGDLTIDLNSLSITFDNSSSSKTLFTVPSDYTLSIEDSGENGQINGGSGSTCYLIAVKSGGTVNVKSGIIASSSGSVSTAIYAYSGGSVNISGGTIITSSSIGTCVYASSATVNITGGTIDATNTSSGIGVNVYNSTVYISDGTIVASSGTGLKCTGATVLNISGGSFEDTSSGTAVLISETSSTPVVTITGGTFKSGAGSGYAFNIEYNGDVTISGGTFSKSGPGGAVLNVGRSSSYTANVTVTGGTFYNESSVYANCNVVCVNGGGSIVVTGGTFKNTSNGGSAVYASGGNASLYGGTYINNSSNRAGYTVYANSTANVTIYDGIYENNCTYTGSYTIYTSGNSASSPTVTIYGGDYSSAGSTLIYKYTYATVSVSGGTYSSDVTSYVDTETYTVTSNGDGTYTVGSTATVPSFYGKNIVLGGEIGIKFYVDFTDVSSPESYSVNFIIDGVTTPVVYTSSVEYTGVSGKTIRYYECEVPCWKMGTTIVAQITNGSTIVETSTYSVATYASNVYSSASDKFKNLLDTMLNFGYYAEDYYEDVKGAALSATVGDSAKQSLDSVSETTLSTYDPTVDGDKTKVMATLVLDETCELRFYVDSGYTVSVDGFTLYEGSDDNGTYYAIQDILVQNWDYGFTVTVKDSSDSVVCTLTKYSVMSYAYTVVSGTGYDDSLVNLVKAMYLYNQAANTYLGLN